MITHTENYLDITGNKKALKLFNAQFKQWHTGYSVVKLPGYKTKEETINAIIAKGYKKNWLAYNLVTNGNRYVIIAITKKDEIKDYSLHNFIKPTTTEILNDIDIRLHKWGCPSNIIMEKISMINMSTEDVYENRIDPQNEIPKYETIYKRRESMLKATGDSAILYNFGSTSMPPTKALLEMSRQYPVLKFRNIYCTKQQYPNMSIEDNLLNVSPLCAGYTYMKGGITTASGEYSNPHEIDALMKRYGLHKEV